MKDRDFIPFAVGILGLIGIMLGAGHMLMRTVFDHVPDTVPLSFGVNVWMGVSVGFFVIGMIGVLVRVVRG